MKYAITGQLPNTATVFEFVYVLKGKTFHIFEGKKVLIKEGDYFLIDINRSHSYTAESEGEEFSIVNCMFMPSFLDGALIYTHRFNDLINNFLITYNNNSFENEPTQNIYHDTDKKIMFLMKQMLDEYKEQYREYKEILRSYLSCALIYLVRNEITKMTSWTLSLYQELYRQQFSTAADSIGDL